ncbi:hypothetical protein Ciccas_010664 [Cichlidogyrus casuarinus]|uniref:Uncharacterized protein n=1 Tax=Cichlidogyrus casuarinus TaxID=1844966 RepID=A0ABD2PWF5_9PLAT
MTEKSSLKMSCVDSAPNSPFFDGDALLFNSESDISNEIESHMLLKSRMIQVSAWFSELAPVKQIAFISVLMRNLHAPFVELVNSCVEKRLEGVRSSELNRDLEEKANNIEYLSTLLSETRPSSIATRLFDLLPFFTRKNKEPSSADSVRDVYFKLVERLICLTAFNDSFDAKFIPRHGNSQISHFGSMISSPNSSFSINNLPSNCTDTFFGQLILLFLTHFEFSSADKADLIDRLQNHHQSIQESIKNSPPTPSNQLLAFERLLECTIAMTHEFIDYFPFDRSSYDSLDFAPTKHYMHSSSIDHGHSRYGQFLHPNACHSQQQQNQNKSASLNSSGFLSGSECFLADNSSSLLSSRMSRASFEADLSQHQHHFLFCGSRSSGLVQPRRQSASAFFLNPTKDTSSNKNTHCFASERLTESDEKEISANYPPLIQIELSPSSPQISTPDKRKFGGSQENLLLNSICSEDSNISHSISMNTDLMSNCSCESVHSFASPHSPSPSARSLSILFPAPQHRRSFTEGLEHYSFNQTLAPGMSSEFHFSTKGSPTTLL